MPTTYEAAVAAGATDAELLAIMKDGLQNDYLDLASEAREMRDIAIANGGDYAEYWDCKASDYSSIANRTSTVQSFAEFTEQYNKYTQPAAKLFGVAGQTFDAGQFISYVKEGDSQNATKKLLTTVAATAVGIGVAAVSGAIVTAVVAAGAPVAVGVSVVAIVAGSTAMIADWAVGELVDIIHENTNWLDSIDGIWDDARGFLKIFGAGFPERKLAQQSRRSPILNHLY